ncbi:MAG: DMT family transporter [candidate division Zixibacteria bacterium]
MAMSLHTLISAGTYLVAKSGLSEFDPLVFAFFRFALASIILSAIIVFRKYGFPFSKSEWPLLILLAVLAIPLNQCMFLYGLQFTLPTHSALLYATTPVWVYLLSAWRKQENMTRAKTMGIFIALIGVTAFFLEKGLAMKTDYLLGDSIILIAVWSWATYTVLGRPIVRQKGAVVVTSYVLILGTLMYFPFGLYLASGFDYSGVTWIGWSGIAYTAILTSVVAYIIWYWSMKRMEPSRTAIFMNLQPIVTALLAYIIMGERLSAGTAISGAIIIMGVYIVQRQVKTNNV